MKKVTTLLSTLALATTLAAQNLPQTERQYLSGHGCDDMVEWDFFCTNGRNSGKWTKIGVPSCWELQGFGTYQYGITFYGKPFPEGVANEKGMYKYEFEVPEKFRGKQVNLVFEASMTDTEVKVTNARYDYENAKLNLEKMKVKAPFDGVIVDLPHYTADTRVEQGKAMVSLMAYDKMYMDINLPESSIRYVKEAQPVYITHYTIPGDTLKARVGELSPAISTETRTFKGKILIDNDQLKLRPGMFAKADIIVDRADSSIIIPKDVILSNRRRKYVYIVEKNTAKIRNLQTGLEDEYNIEILSGLNVNDNLVVKGFETLKEDAKVKIQK